MKKLILVLLSGLLVSVAGCSKKSTTPEQEPTQDYTLQASQTIGSEGGTLSIDDFSLTVPEGAFSSDAELKLYASSKDKQFGDNCASRTFRLEGLPDEYSQPLQLSIKYQGTLSDSSFIAVGEEAMVAGSGELKTAYQMLSATDSTGCLHCELPASEGGTLFPKRNNHQTISGSDKGRKFLVTSKFLAVRYMYTPLDKHYTIYVPSGVAINVTDFADLLDTSYVTFDRLGYFFVNIADVIVRDLGTDDYCKFKYRNRDRYGYIEVNAKKMTQSHFPKLQVMIGREVYRWILFSGVYDPYYPVMVGPVQQDYYWLNEAAVSWCEEWFVPAEERSNYVPDDFSGNEMVPFNGMQAGIQAGQGDVVTKARNHGCGMSAMTKYLDEHFVVVGNPTETILCLIHTRLGIIFKKHPIEAIIAGIGSPEGLPKNWWWDFLKKYVQGDIYNVSGNVFTREKNISGMFDIESDDDTLAKFPESYPDLSAKFYRINLRHKTMAENAMIELKVSTSVAAEDIKLVLFKFDGNALTFLKYGHLRVLIENARQFTDEGVDLVAMVVNSSYHLPDYTANSDIDLEITVSGKAEMAYNWCRIAFHANMHFSVGDTADYWKETLVSWEGEGSFLDNKFTATWQNTEDPNDHSKISSGSMTVVVDPVRTDSFDVVSFSATKTADRPEGGYPEEASISGNNIPFNEFDDLYNLFLRCLEQGTEACTRVGSFNYERSFPTYGEKVTGPPQCNTESEVRIVFWEWHGE